jgi:hypothetical protein
MEHANPGNGVAQETDLKERKLRSLQDFGSLHLPASSPPTLNQLWLVELILNGNYADVTVKLRQQGRPLLARRTYYPPLLAIGEFVHFMRTQRTFYPAKFEADWNMRFCRCQLRFNPIRNRPREGQGALISLQFLLPLLP